MNQELLDLDTFVAVKKAAPKVTVMPFDVAAVVVEGLDRYASAEQANKDENGHVYWMPTVKDIAGLVSLTPAQIGRAVKQMGLESWRKMDGYHFAFSSEQLDILKHHFHGI
jgi:hypothetical protein